MQSILDGYIKLPYIMYCVSQKYNALNVIAEKIKNAFLSSITDKAALKFGFSSPANSQKSSHSLKIT